MAQKASLDDLKIDVKLKLSALWISATLLYLYGDIIGLYEPGSIQSMLDGNMGFWGPMPADEAILLMIAAVMAIPCVMVVLSLVLQPAVNRWLNVVAGVIYTAIVLIVMPQALDKYFFQLLSAVEAVLTGLIVWFALTWPRQLGRRPVNDL